MQATDYDKSGSPISPPVEFTKDTPGVIPPPPIFGSALLIGLGLDWLWPYPVLPDLTQYWIGGVVTALSFVLIALVLREFVRAKTSFSSHSPSSALITSGPFRYSRNPAYLSLSMLYVGIGIVVDSVDSWSRYHGNSHYALRRYSAGRILFGA